MTKYTVTNVLDLVESVGVEEAQKGLSEFSCPLNEERRMVYVSYPIRRCM